MRLDFGRMMPATFWNVRGHFEDEFFVELHARLLERNFPGSFGWKIFKRKNIYIKEFEAKMVQGEIERRSSLSNLWGWKDPRSIFFLKYWLESNKNLIGIVIFRDYLEVVASLRFRSERAISRTPSQARLLEVTEESALRLWIAHNQLALDLKSAFRHRVILVGLSEFISNSERLFNLLEKVSENRLRYVPLNSLFESSLLSKIECPTSNPASVERYATANRILNELKSLSDLNCA